MDKTEKDLMYWKSLDDKKDIQPEIAAEISILDARIKSVNDGIEKFLRLTEDVEEDNAIEQKKIEDTMTKVVDIIDGLGDRTEAESMKIKSVRVNVNNPEERIVEIRTQQGASTPKVPKFKGNKAVFHNFWKLFSASIKHESDDLMKFNMRINVLEDKPKELMENFNMDGDNFQKAVDLLHKRYGD
uniref:Uncharacterized protein n=1 Tax=Caenorhabditis japonica TaxID=281687 RepID=A0A8R1IA03_CAEJA